MNLEELWLDGKSVEWPYPVNYEKENNISCDVLVLGGGIAGCRAAIVAAKMGMRVALVEKGCTIRSGSGGAGCDHWLYTANPLSPVEPEEMVDAESSSTGGYTNGISRYIASREGYDALLELEGIGCKIRDTEDEFKGAEFRDEKTKFCFSYDYVNKLHYRVWGTTFKPALYKECRRLGVEIYDRTQATSLLTEHGEEGNKVVGATGVNVRTGEFYVFSSKATVLTVARPQRIWQFSSEVTGFNSLRPQTCIGNGHAMAWRAGAALTMMEKSVRSLMGSGMMFPQYGTGNPFNTWHACSMIDADGKEIPWIDRNERVLTTVSERYRPAPGQKFLGERAQAMAYRHPHIIPDILGRIKRGEYKLPLYADLPGMPEMERKVIFGMMVGEEGKTDIPIVRTYAEAGFDPNKDLLQSYTMLLGDMIAMGTDTVSTGLPQQRTFGEVGDAGGLVIDWNLKTSLDGLYAAGDQLFGGNYHHHASTTGRYAGRKAAEYATNAGEPIIDKEQVKREKARVYAPVNRAEGINWKELNMGMCRIMQNYCGDPKNEELLKIGMLWLKDLEDNIVPTLYATDPHKLGRAIDVMDLLTCSQIIIQACQARKASSKFLDFNRLDFPQYDPPEWKKWITVKRENGVTKIGELPIDFWGPLKENYEVQNKGYQGWYKS